MKKLIHKISPFIVMDILAKARTMKDVIHMEIGEPDLPPSERVLEAYAKAIRDKNIHYTPARGLMQLREKIADYYGQKYGVTVSPERVIVTPGTSGAFIVAFGLLADSEKRPVLSDPGYPCYKNFAYFLNTEPIIVPIGKETHYEILGDSVQSLKNVGILVISSPANPIGNLYRENTLEALIDISDTMGFMLVSDEIYHGLVYDKKERSALEFSDRVIVVNGFSKYFCMPGLRIGWMILPEDLVRKAEMIVQNIFIAANTPAQYAALEAFDDEHLLRVSTTFKKRRDFLYEELKKIVVIDAFPDAAFYLWADISRYSNDAVTFCSDLLESKGVAITPGIDFGRNQTDFHIRFAYTQEIDALKEGVRRLKEYLSTLTVKKKGSERSVFPDPDR